MKIVYLMVSDKKGNLVQLGKFSTYNLTKFLVPNIKDTKIQGFENFKI